MSVPTERARMTIASIAGLDNHVVAMIYGHFETAPDDPDLPVFVLSLEGAIDHDAAPYLDRAMVRALSGGTAVCCDLSGTSFFGTASAAVTLLAAQHAETKGIAFALRGVRAAAERILAGVGLDQRFINDRFST